MPQSMLEFVGQEYKENQRLFKEKMQPITDFLEGGVAHAYKKEEEQKLIDQGERDFEYLSKQYGSEEKFNPTVSVSTQIAGLEKTDTENKKYDAALDKLGIDTTGMSYLDKKRAYLAHQEEWTKLTMDQKEASIAGKDKPKSLTATQQTQAEYQDYLSKVGLTNVPSGLLKDVMVKYNEAAGIINTYNTDPKMVEIKEILQRDDEGFKQSVKGKKAGNNKVWVNVGEKKWYKKKDKSSDVVEDGKTWRLVEAEDIYDYVEDISEEDASEFVNMGQKYKESERQLKLYQNQYGGTEPLTGTVTGKAVDEEETVVVDPAKGVVDVSETTVTTKPTETYSPKIKSAIQYIKDNPGTPESIKAEKMLTDAGVDLSKEIPKVKKTISTSDGDFTPEGMNKKIAVKEQIKNNEERVKNLKKYLVKKPYKIENGKKFYKVSFKVSDTGAMRTKETISEEELMRRIKLLEDDTLKKEKSLGIKRKK